MLSTNEKPEIVIAELNLQSIKNLSREDFCQNCDAWICIENCRNCLFNALLGYKSENKSNLYD
jgi:hypothetical protein